MFCLYVFLYTKKACTRIVEIAVKLNTITHYTMDNTSRLYVGHLELYMSNCLNPMLTQEEKKDVHAEFLIK